MNNSLAARLDAGSQSAVASDHGEGNSQGSELKQLGDREVISTLDIERLYQSSKT